MALGGTGIPIFMSRRFFPQTGFSTVRLAGASTHRFLSIGRLSSTAFTGTGLTPSVNFTIPTGMVSSHAGDFMAAVFTVWRHHEEAGEQVAATRPEMGRERHKPGPEKYKTCFTPGNRTGIKCEA